MTIWLELRQQFGRGGGGARICWRALKVTAPTLALPNATEHINAYYNVLLNAYRYALVDILKCSAP